MDDETCAGFRLESPPDIPTPPHPSIRIGAPLSDVIFDDMGRNGRKLDCQLHDRETLHNASLRNRGGMPAKVLGLLYQ